MMAEEKKPKIDLKSRLQKMGAGAQAPPPSSSSMPAPRSTPMPPRSNPALGGIPTPFQSVAPGLDPSNPLAAVVSPVKSLAPQAAPVAPPQPQRIEVDEGAVKQARSGARKQMLLVALVLGVAMFGVGWAGGGASEKADARKKLVQDVKDLDTDLGKAKDTLRAISEKVEAARSVLTAPKDAKFPSDLGADLAKIKVDFDGGKLAGKRLSAMDVRTGQELVGYITAIEMLHEKKSALQNALSKHQKAVTEELAARSAGNVPIQWAVVLEKETLSQGVHVAALSPAFVPTKDKPLPPEKISVLAPNGQKEEMPRLTGEKIPEKGRVAIALVPQSVDKAFNADSKGVSAQLVKQMSAIVNDIRGEKAASEEMDPKPGLIDRADALKGLLSKMR